MKPVNLHTKIFLDSGDPGETKQALQLLGFLDGQTTNPSLFAKNPAVQERLKRGEKFSRDEVLSAYRNAIQEISALIPDGSVSVEVYADAQTSADTIVIEARAMFAWIPNPDNKTSCCYGAGAHVKIPITKEGLAAAERLVREGIRVNMTLCFTQAQAAAVYAATRPVRNSPPIGPSGAQSAGEISNGARGQVFISPFVGRLDDRGANGMDFIVHCIRLYRESDHHVEVLTASVRTIDHFLYAIALQSDIITAPLSVLREWQVLGMPVPGSDYVYDAKGKSSIPYEALDLSQPWQSFDIHHELTDAGIEKFAKDWNALIK